MSLEDSVKYGALGELFFRFSDIIQVDIQICHYVFLIGGLKWLIKYQREQN